MKPEEALSQALEHFQSGRLQEASRLYRALVGHGGPTQAEASHMLGVVLAMTGKPGEGVELIRRAISLAPDSSTYAANLGLALRMAGRPLEAFEAFSNALRLDPDHVGAHLNLGNLLQERGELGRAADHHRQAEALAPSNPDAPYNLGVVLRELGRLEEAAACFSRSLSLRPGFADALNNLGTVLAALGQVEEALNCLHQATKANPGSASIHSNFLYTLHLHPAVGSQRLFQEHRAWNQRHARSLAPPIQPHGHDHNPGRPLRVAYVSPRFCRLPEGRFLLPLFREHDPARFEILCYSDTQKIDELTAELRSHAKIWRDIRGLPDEEVARLIRSDQADLAVDLMLHGANNRLMAFARKPAPVQVTYLGYCATTGLDAMDYRLSDPHFDPPGSSDEFYSEKTIRLPGSYWCYEPVVDLQPGPLPALQNGFITFGSLNTFSKVSAPTLAAWVRILQAVPDSRLLLSAPEGRNRERIRTLFASKGLDPERLRFTGNVPLEDYFKLYHQVDLVLDTFPRGGGTTLCDALWMGVPVVSQVGATVLSRAGLSVLSNAGFPELAGHGQEEYVEIAAALAQDLPRLEHLRATLRPRLEQSPLMDAKGFARGVEEAYLVMWREWCGPVPTGP